jgi:isopropylmalate/homocitrate/citramalate synthase
VVFAAGFPSVCGQEFSATRRVALEAQESVSPTAICRGTAEDVRLALRAARGAAHAREALAAGLDVVRAAVEEADGVAVDVCLVDAPRADPALMTEYAAAMTAQGAGTIVLADTVGDLLPGQARALFDTVRAGAGEDTVLVSHLHDDLGLGLANTLAAVAERLGHHLDADRTRAALTWVKDRAYRLNHAVGADADFAAHLDGLATAPLTAEPRLASPHRTEADVIDVVNVSNVSNVHA